MFGGFDYDAYRLGGVILKTILLKDLIKKFTLEVLAGEGSIKQKYISAEEIHRPGLELTGFYDHFPNDRVQILGKQEMNYLLSLKVNEQQERIQKYFELNPPCVIVTRGLPVTEYFIKMANNKKIVVLRTSEKTAYFMSNLYSYLQKELAPETGIHGVCVNVYGVGILIRGAAGVGKSELALSLVERGHRLISDDLVVLKKIGPVALIGTHYGVNRDFLSLRGVGFVNVPRLYGAGSVQDETKINLDILLSPWKDGEYYDALGIDEVHSEYLDTIVPLIEIPIRPGRDIASLIEVAAKNWRLNIQGYNTLDDFNSRFENE